MVPEVLSKDSMTFPSERKEQEASKFRKNDCESEAFLDSRRSRSLFGWRRRREEYGWSAWVGDSLQFVRWWRIFTIKALFDRYAEIFSTLRVTLELWTLNGTVF